MNFLIPLGFLGLLAGIPIVMLYFLKLRRQKRIVPSTLLWKKVINDLHVNSPFQRLKYSLLLLLQLLIVLLLAFALSRPFLNMPAAQSKHLILMIDTSASMQTRDVQADPQLPGTEKYVTRLAGSRPAGRPTRRSSKRNWNVSGRATWRRAPARRSRRS